MRWKNTISMKNIPAVSSVMATLQVKQMLCFFTVLLSTQVVASGTILIPDDSNSRITVENAVIDGDKTTVFFYTSPYLGDPNAGKPCPLNYYSVTLQPGLPSAKADTVAKGVCGGLFQKSRLLDNGEALILIRDRVEHWRGGEKINSRTFSSIKDMEKLGVTTDMMGGQFYDISANGDVVLLIQSGNHNYDSKKYGGFTMVMAALKPDGSRRWEERFSGDAIPSGIDRIWAAPGGSALLFVTYISGGLASEISQLEFISASGTRKTLQLARAESPFDILNMGKMSPQELQKILASQGNSNPESIKKLVADARADGGFDVLFQRTGGEQGREGFFLYRIGADGALLSEHSLGNRIIEHGLEHWSDFYVDDQQLVLLSRVQATQHGVNSKRKQWAQNAVSWFDLNSGTHTTRLIPLDSRYLEAAMNAGDEQRQYLDGTPGGEPALLTTIDGVPLTVSIGKASRRPALRLNEATDQLIAYTEVHDEKQVTLAKEASRQQRKADREASMQRMKADEAAAAGMSEEEYFALSNKEQKKALIRNGGMDELMQSMARQSQDMMARQRAQQDSSGQQPAIPAEMAAIMAQIGLSPGGNNAMPGLPNTQPQQAPTAALSSDSAALPGQPLKLNINQQGFLEFDSADGRAMTLLIVNRQTGEELLKKDYPDGAIYEHVDFSRFNLPLNQIGVIYKEIDGVVLKDLTPVITQ